VEQSPFELAKTLQGMVQSRLSGIDIDSLPPHERELLRQIKRQLTDIRLDIRDYGLSETRAEQKHRSKAAITRLGELQHQLLQASEYNIFGAADVAIISALIQQLMTEL
jgi:hypothetical protein